MAAPTPPTRDRVVDAAMRLFGERGYAATSIADIESAAGLSPGSGSLYRHFASKEALLMEGVRRRVSEGAALRAALQHPPIEPVEPRVEYEAVVRAGLDRLDQDKDLSRMINKDLRQFPAALDLVRDEEIGAVHRAVATWLQARAPQPLDDRRAQALATVMVGAAANFWLLGDIFDEHPAGVTVDEVVDAIVSLIDAWFAGQTALP
jgi:AcrR family transcriptional regulator